jgi:hypothetical protein
VIERGRDGERWREAIDGGKVDGWMGRERGRVGWGRVYVGGRDKWRIG